MKAFEVFVTFAAIDHLSGPMQKMARDMGVIGEQSEATQKRLAKFKNMAFVGAGITAFGGLMAKGLLSAADAAGKVQTSLMGVQAALKLNHAEYEKAGRLAQTVGLPTIFSQTDVASIMRTMGTAGLSKRQVLNAAILRRYVNLADVQAQLKHEEPSTVVSTAIGMAHMYQLYSAKQLTPFLNTYNAALLHTHDTAAEFGTQFRYIANQTRAMGVNAEGTMAITSWLGRMGFGGGRGGTNFADFLRRSIYHSSGKSADTAMLRAGFVHDGHSVFETAAGKFVGIRRATEIMQAFSRRFHGNSNQESPLLNKIFGAQGARVALMMTSGGAGEQYTRTIRQIQGTASINGTQEGLNKTWAGQTKQLATTLEDIWTNLGKAAMPTLLKIVESVNNVVGAVLKFTQTHPAVMRMVAIFAEIATAAALVIGPVMVFVGALGWLVTSGVVMAGLSVIGSAIGALVTPLLIVGAGVALLWQMWKHDFGHIREFTYGVIQSIKTYWFGVTDYAGKRADWFAKHYKKKHLEIKIVMNNFEIDAKAAWKAIGQSWGEMTGNMYTSFKWMSDHVMMLIHAIEVPFNAIADTFRQISAMGSRWNYLMGGNTNTGDAAALARYGVTDEQAKQLRQASHGASIQALPAHSLWSRAWGAVTGHNAMGTDFWRGGPTWVGERGPEIVNLPRGSQVTPNNAIGGGVNAEIHIHAAPGQSPEAIAEAVQRSLSRLLRNRSYASPDTVLSAF